MKHFIKSRGWGDKLYNSNELYHSVGYPRINALLKNDALYAVWEHKIDNKEIYGSCLSRSHRLGLELSHRSPVQFILDKEKIKQHHKIIPVQSEYQYLKNFNKNFERIIKDDFSMYSRSSFHKMHNEWNEEFVVGTIENLSSLIKGIVYLDGYGLSFYERNNIYREVREYAKQHDIPLAVDIDFLKKQNTHLLRQIMVNLEEYEDEKNINTKSVLEFT